MLAELESCDLRAALGDYEFAVRLVGRAFDVAEDLSESGITVYGPPQAILSSLTDLFVETAAQSCGCRVTYRWPKWGERPWSG